MNPKGDITLRKGMVTSPGYTVLSTTRKKSRQLSPSKCISDVRSPANPVTSLGGFCLSDRLQVHTCGVERRNSPSHDTNAGTSMNKAGRQAASNNPRSPRSPPSLACLCSAETGPTPYLHQEETQVPHISHCLYMLRTSAHGQPREGSDGACDDACLQREATVVSQSVSQAKLGKKKEKKIMTKTVMMRL